MDAQDTQFENGQDTLQETLEKRGTPKDEIKVILDRRREMYELDNRPPRIMETRIPQNPSTAKWEAETSFVRTQGYAIHCDGRLIGIMESAGLADLVVSSHNATSKKWNLI